MLDSSLLDACETGDIFTIQNLLSQGANVEARESDDDYNYTPLILTCYAGYVNVAKYLISFGADVNACSRNGTTSLFMACQEGHCDIAELLISHDVDVNATMNDKTSPLYIACQNGFYDVVALLLKSNANMNTSVDNGSTPLIVACAHQHKEIASLLMKAGADVNAHANDGRTALHSACIKGNLQIVMDLVQFGASLNSRDETGFTPLHDACRLGKADVVCFLLEHDSSPESQLVAGWNGNTGLHLACWKGHARVVWWFLLKSTVALDTQNCFGFTPLHLAILGDHVDIIAMMLSKGANAMLANCDQNTSLHLAAMKGNLEIIKLLVSYGSDLTQCNLADATPVEVARQTGHLEVADYLTVTQLLQDSSHPDLRHKDEDFSEVCNTQRTETFISQASNYRAGVSMENICFIPKSVVLDANRIPSYEECKRNDWLVPGNAIKEGSRTLFVSHNWRGNSQLVDIHGDAYRILKIFLEHQGSSVEWIWTGFSCICQTDEEQFRKHAINIPTVALYASQCLMIPSIEYFPSTFDESNHIQVSNLAGYIGQSWCLLEAMSAILARNELWLSFQCGTYTGYHRFDRPEVAGSNLGFYQAQVSEWNMLWQSNNQDQTAVRYALEDKWQNIKEPCAVLQLALEICRFENQDSLSLGDRIIREGLTKSDVQCSAHLMKLYSRLGSADREEDKRFVLNMILFMSLYTNSITKRDDASEFNELVEEMEIEHTSGINKLKRCGTAPARHLEHSYRETSNIVEVKVGKPSLMRSVLQYMGAASPNQAVAPCQINQNQHPCEMEV